MPYITIDPYYDTSFFNECKQALLNNDVNFKVHVSVKAPYDWYFEVDNTPIMVNYDVASKSESRWLVSTVTPLKPNEEYLLLRRENDNGKNALAKFIENTPLKEARKSDYAVFFTVKNREELETLSEEYHGKIWYFGKYYSNKYRVCLGTHETIKGYLNPKQILLEKESDMNDPGRFESELNFKVFRGNDYLVKFSSTPYFQNGKYIRPKIKGDTSGKFLL